MRSGIPGRTVMNDTNATRRYHRYSRPRRTSWCPIQGPIPRKKVDIQSSDKDKRRKELGPGDRRSHPPVKNNDKQDIEWQSFNIENDKFEAN